MTAFRPAGRSALRIARRAGPHVALGLILALGGIAVWQAWTISNHLRGEARETSRVFGRVIAALGSPDGAASAQTLLDIALEIRASGLPLVLTDSLGRPTDGANLPFGPDVSLDDPRVTAYVRELDRVNPPVPGPVSGQIHFGAIPVARQLRLLAALQVGLLLTTIAVALWAYRVALDRNRERLWVAMARESAHQLGTPLMSARAWIDRLADAGEPARDVARQLSADMDRLQRVVQRFERIGRPGRTERVGLGALVERVAAYFGPRLPRHSHQVRIAVHAPTAGPNVQGDPVLLEWALEALVRNAVDALSGRGGTITITVEAGAARARVEVSDDGPGVAAEVRDSLFEPGVTTKTGGWGIGLALVRRIVEDVHGGELELLDGSPGATFRVTLPVEAAE